MIVVASRRLSGFFAIATTWVMERAKAPLTLLCGAIATSGIFSAFLVNDAKFSITLPSHLSKFRSRSSFIEISRFFSAHLTAASSA
jgi:Na+/H+ antiporter NhaD/arsenite permease-like protein